MSRVPRESRRVRSTCRPMQTTFDVALAVDALPLVRRIVQDIRRLRTRLVQAQAEQRQFRNRERVADHPGKRFLLADEIRQLRDELRGVIDELHRVGATLLDSVRGDIGFPTIVNGSLAYLVYRSEDDAIAYWRYRDQPKLRPIPSQWQGMPVVHRMEEEEGLLVNGC
jgi:hypothetical protein